MREREHQRWWSVVVGAACVAAAAAVLGCGTPQPNDAMPSPRECGIEPPSAGARGRAARPYASVPLSSDQPTTAFFPLVRERLGRQGFRICSADPERGIVMTSPRTLRAPGGERRHVAVAVYIVARRPLADGAAGSEGQLWIVQGKGERADAGDAAEQRAAARDLEAIARQVRERVTRP